jgi:hypothetical protein
VGREKRSVCISCLSMHSASQPLFLQGARALLLPPVAPRCPGFRKESTKPAKCGLVSHYKCHIHSPSPTQMSLPLPAAQCHSLQSAGLGTLSLPCGNGSLRCRCSRWLFTPGHLLPKKLICRSFLQEDPSQQVTYLENNCETWLKVPSHLPHYPCNLLFRREN